MGLCISLNFFLLLYSSFLDFFLSHLLCLSLDILCVWWRRDPSTLLIFMHFFLQRALNSGSLGIAAPLDNGCVTSFKYSGLNWVWYDFITGSQKCSDPFPLYLEQSDLYFKRDIGNRVAQQKIAGSPSQRGLLLKPHSGVVLPLRLHWNHFIYLFIYCLFCLYKKSLTIF